MKQEITLISNQYGGLDLYKDGKPTRCKGTPIPCNTNCMDCNAVNLPLLYITCGCVINNYKVSDKKPK